MEEVQFDMIYNWPTTQNLFKFDKLNYHITICYCSCVINSYPSHLLNDPIFVFVFIHLIQMHLNTVHIE